MCKPMKPTGTAEDAEDGAEDAEEDGNLGNDPSALLCVLRVLCG